MKLVDNTISNLFQKIREKEHRSPIKYKEFLTLSAENPDLVFRDIFRIFYDMIYSHVGDGINEYPDDPESINYVYYDSSSLFEHETDHPFFADRLFANRFVNHVSTFSRGIPQNRIYIFEGPHGCGKSTFLNNLLLKFETYTKTEQGKSYETIWRLDKKKLGLHAEQETYAILNQLRSLAQNNTPGSNKNSVDGVLSLTNKEYLEVPCPSHDNPLLLIPKAYRKDFFNDLIKDEKFKEKLFSEKQYEWLFRGTPCTICMSLYQTLLDQLDSPSEVFDMVFARRYQFNRRLGEGISVYNPGDRGARENVITNQLLQNQLNGLLKDSNSVKYIFSRYARTNNGVYSLMDIKDHNRERFANLHGIISEGVHKVEDIEENVNSLFLALMNPEDRVDIADTQSFSDRIIYIKIPYILDYNTEVKIYKNVFGDKIEKDFLPRVLQNFAKVIISSRLKPKSDTLSEWIGNPEKYSQFCDKNLHLLKMELFTGLIPAWLSEEDRKEFNAKRRRRVIAESELEGDHGFSGRDSIKIFNDFYSTYKKAGNLITMGMLHNYFQKRRSDLVKSIPEGFLDSLIKFYNYAVLQQVKESLYYYNEEQISRDIKNYLFAINFETGAEKRCVYTGEELSITEGFFEAIERRLLGAVTDANRRISFRKDIQKHYASNTLTQEILVDGKEINETEIYKELRDRYIHNLKEKVMDPFLKNDNFRNAIKDFDTESFKTYDKRIKEEVIYLIKNLHKKYEYSEQGAKEVCIYVIDNDLATTYSEK